MTVTSAAALPAPAVLLRALFDAAIDAASPARRVAPFLPPRPRGRTVVVGAGKAAAAMAQAVEEAWDGPLEGLVVTRYGHGRPDGRAGGRISVVEASHPVPDAAGADAAQRILRAVQGLTADDLVLFLISGGGSALLAAPAPGLTLADKRAVTGQLLRCGATIQEINAVRKHLSAIKGGRLAAAAFPARMVTLAISDVPGDDPAVIASGPTVPDPTSFAEARAVLARHGVTPPDAVARHLAEAAEETPKPGDPRLAGHLFHLIARPLESLVAAADRARDFGCTPLILGDAIEGEAREVGRAHAGIALSVAQHGLPVAPPAVILSGGETTVTVRGAGRGGRNLEFLLGLGLGLGPGPAGAPDIHAIACDTDGIDGTEDNAGALWLASSPARALAAGLNAEAALAGNDGYGFFQGLGDLVVTGPTRTNVNDFRAMLILPPRAGQDGAG